MTETTETEPRRQTSLWRFLRERPAFLSFIATRACDELASQMLNVAIGWYVYSATHNPMSLAYVGLARFLPKMFMLPIAGHAADRFDRRKVVAAALVVQTIFLAIFSVWLRGETRSVGPVYVLLVILSSAHACFSPAMSAMLPRLVGAEEFPRAVAVASSSFQISTIVGPAIGGLIYAFNGRAAFLAATFFSVLATTQVARLKLASSPPEPELSPDRGVLAGLRYVFANRLLLALISLDLFAVLFGGAVALLPIYANDILRVGPIGLGSLRCAPSVGAALVGVFLSHRTIERGVGKLMLACVAGFGAATIVFAVSANALLSLAALAIAGGFDMVSMVIRQTLVQTSTPDAMRGRVSAVNYVFIGASNELGEFESGAVAARLGAVGSALFGGVGTLVVVALWMKLFPEILKADGPLSADVEGAEETRAESL